MPAPTLLLVALPLVGMSRAAMYRAAMSRGAMSRGAMSQVAAQDRTFRVAGPTLFQGTAPVRLTGVEIPGLESLELKAGSHVFRTCRVALEDWKANCILLPVSQDRWFGRTPDEKGNGENYRLELEQISSYVSRSDAYLVIELASSDAGVWGKNQGKHNAPDANSLTFWKEAAHKFRGNDHVLFGLFRDPKDIPVSVLLNGGEVREEGLTYPTPGLNSLLKEIRSVGAKNVAVVSLPGEARDPAGLDDPNGMGDILALRLGDRTPTTPPRPSTAVLYAIGNSDRGAETSLGPSNDPALEWVEGQKANWVALNMSPESDSIRKLRGLLVDWTFAPLAGFGEKVKSELARARTHSGSN